MLGVKTSGVLFTQPSQPGSLSIGVTSLLSGGTVYEKSDGVVDCSDSVGGDDGFSYFDNKMWKPTCPMFRDVI